mgnify:CR=1 FL=1
MTIKEAKACSYCGASITRVSKWSMAQWERKKFCSADCQRKGRDKSYTKRAWNSGAKRAIPRKCDVCDTVSERVNFYKQFSSLLCGKHYWHLYKHGKILWADVRPLKTPAHHRLRRSKKMADWRMAVFKRDDFTCQMCGERGGKLNADHIKPFALFPELRLVLTNGRTLCVPCHKATPSYLNPHLKKLYVV